jgi:hypothetical protein
MKILKIFNNLINPPSSPFGKGETEISPSLEKRG